MAGATRYPLSVDAIGSWWSPTAAEGTSCDPAWTAQGDGTIPVAFDAPPGSWLVVTARNACGEGPAGRSSRGVERSSAASWTPCPWTPGSSESLGDSDWYD
jgi:hypothetical protein